MKAAIFDFESGNPVRVMSAASVAPFITACRPGQTWRIVPDDTTIMNVPDIDTLPIPPELQED